MNLGKLLAPLLAAAGAVTSGVGLFDPSIPPGTRTGTGLTGAVVVAAWLIGHHGKQIADVFHEIARVNAGATVAAAKAQAGAADSAAAASHVLGSIFGQGAPPAGSVPPGSGASPAGAPLAHVAQGADHPLPGGTS